MTSNSKKKKKFKSPGYITRLRHRYARLQKAYDALDAYCAHVVSLLPDEGLLALHFPEHRAPNAAHSEDEGMAAVGLGDERST